MSTNAEATQLLLDAYGKLTAEEGQALDALLAEVEQLRAALTTLLRFARPVDIQACLIQGGVDVEAAVRG